MPTAAKSSTPRCVAVAVSMPRWACRVSMICVPMVSTGLSEVIGSWKTTASSGPRRRRSSSGASERRSRPSNRMRPPSRRALGQQLQDGARQHGLAAARLADDAERAARRQREIDAVDGAQGAARRRQVDGYALDRQQRRCGHSAPGRGSVSARSVSPTTLNGSTVRNMTAGRQEGEPAARCRGCRGPRRSCCPSSASAAARRGRGTRARPRRRW